MKRFAFIAAWKKVWPIELLCRVLQVTSRGFRAWRARPMSRRQRDDMVILAHIREQRLLSLGSYGRSRMTEELQEQGLDVGHRRVGRLMVGNGIKAVRTKKYKSTTDSNHAFAVAPKAQLIWRRRWETGGRPRLPCSNTSTASTIPADGTQPSTGKAR
jgi:putative transposase